MLQRSLQTQHRWKESQRPAVEVSEHRNKPCEGTSLWSQIKKEIQRNEELHEQHSSSTMAEVSILMLSLEQRAAYLINNNSMLH